MRAISSMAFTHVYDTSHPSSSQRFWQVQLDLLQQCLLDFSPSIFAMYKSPSYFMIFQSAHSNAKFSLFLHQYKAASRQHFSWIGLIQFDWKSMDCNSTRPTLRLQLFFDLISANPCCPIQFPCIYCHRLSSCRTYIGYNNMLYTARAREKYNLLYI